jgi:hypothetical protein
MPVTWMSDQERKEYDDYVYGMLQHVEREVWSKVSARMAMVVEDKDSLHEWVRGQQKELG